MDHGGPWDSSRVLKRSVLSAAFASLEFVWFR